MTLMLTDIRCGCGGLCDSAELCPMRGNVEACDCGAMSIVHSRGQVGCLHKQPPARLTFGTCHCGETERVLIEGHCAPCIETCRPALLAPPTRCTLCGGQDGEHDADAHAEEGRW